MAKLPIRIHKLIPQDEFISVTATRIFSEYMRAIGPGSTTLSARARKQFIDDSIRDAKIEYTKYVATGSLKPREQRFFDRFGKKIMRDIGAGAVTSKKSPARSRPKAVPRTKIRRR